MYIGIIVFKLLKHSNELIIKTPTLLEVPTLGGGGTAPCASPLVTALGGFHWPPLGPSHAPITAQPVTEKTLAFTGTFDQNPCPNNMLIIFTIKE